jgi:hypothetical protein
MIAGEVLTTYIGEGLTVNLKPVDPFRQKILDDYTIRSYVDTTSLETSQIISGGLVVIFIIVDNSIFDLILNDNEVIVLWSEELV